MPAASEFSGTSPPAGWRRTLRATGILPWVLPLFYVIFVWSLQPADRLGDPPAAPRLGRLLYDDYDWTAATLRGLNASQGRLPGRTTDPCTEELDAPAFARALRSRHVLRPRYFLEYPQTALLLFELGHRYQRRPPGPPPGAMLDACHNRIVEHIPADADQRQWWARFRHAIVLYQATMTGCLFALMAVLPTGYGLDRMRSGRLALLILPGTLYFTLNRFDIWPAALTAFSFVPLGRRRYLASGACWGTAAMVKVYPVVLVPMMALFLRRDRGATASWLAGVAGSMLVLLALPLWTTGWDATLSPYRYQLARAPEGFTFYGFLFPAVMASSTPLWRAVRMFAVLVPALGLAWPPPQDLVSLLRRSAVVLILFMSVQVFYSPQWLIWLVPFLVPLTAIDRWLVGWVICFDLATYLTFPILYDRMGPFAYDSIYAVGYPILLGVRFVLQAGIVAGLLWTEYGPRQRPL